MFKQARFFLISVLMVGLTASFACATPNRSMMDSGKDFVTPHSLADKNIVGVQGYDLVSYPSAVMATMWSSMMALPIFSLIRKIRKRLLPTRTNTCLHLADIALTVLL